MVVVLGFADHIVCVETLQLHCCSSKVARGSMSVKGMAMLNIKLFSKTDGRMTWLMGRSLVSNLIKKPYSNVPNCL